MFSAFKPATAIEKLSEPKVKSCHPPESSVKLRGSSNLHNISASNGDTEKMTLRRLEALTAVGSAGCD